MDNEYLTLTEIENTVDNQAQEVKERLVITHNILLEGVSRITILFMEDGEPAELSHKLYRILVDAFQALDDVVDIRIIAEEAQTKGSTAK